MADDFSVAGVAYRTRRISAARQLALYRRLLPVLPALTGLDASLRSSDLDASRFLALFAPLRDVGDNELDEAFADCLDAVERVDGELIEALPLPTLVPLVLHVVWANFDKLFSMPRPNIVPCPRGKSGKGFSEEYGPVEMPAGEDWLYAPMLARHCTYRELHDGSLQIEDVQKLNDLLAVETENTVRFYHGAEQG